MYARLIRFDGVSEDEWGVGSGWFLDDYLPVAEETDGFEGAYLLVDRERGNVVSVTLWRDRATVEASEPAVQAHLDHYAELTGRTTTIETFEAAHARPPTP